MGINHDIREAVRARLADLGWSQAELARRSGVHAVNIAQWLGPSASRELGPESLDKVFSALRLRIDVKPARKDS